MRSWMLPTCKCVYGSMYISGSEGWVSLSNRWWRQQMTEADGHWSVCMHMSTSWSPFDVRTNVPLLASVYCVCFLMSSLSECWIARWNADNSMGLVLMFHACSQSLHMHGQHCDANMSAMLPALRWDQASLDTWLPRNECVITGVTTRVNQSRLSDQQLVHPLQLTPSLSTPDEVRVWITATHG